jgi:hypothetical protein
MTEGEMSANNAEFAPAASERSTWAFQNCPALRLRLFYFPAEEIVSQASL